MVKLLSEMGKIMAQAESELFPGHTHRSSQSLDVETEQPHLRAYFLEEDVEFPLPANHGSPHLTYKGNGESESLFRLQCCAGGQTKQEVIVYLVRSF